MAPKQAWCKGAILTRIYCGPVNVVCGENHSLSLGSTLNAFAHFVYLFSQESTVLADLQTSAFVKENGNIVQRLFDIMTHTLDGLIYAVPVVLVTMERQYGFPFINSTVLPLGLLTVPFGLSVAANINLSIIGFVISELPNDKSTSTIPPTVNEIPRLASF
ncbi:hypothetical protein C8R45DRAFT_928427 [Mycena sanguinolenta]|nr:hypothetical protein C8R45DRAFT_928427 [Mycena sanguinolenta]